MLTIVVACGGQESIGAKTQAVCTDGPQDVSAPAGLTVPVIPAYRYPEGGCQITWATDSSPGTFPCAGPSWDNSATDNILGDGQWHWDELDKRRSLVGWYVCN